MSRLSERGFGIDNDNSHAQVTNLCSNQTLLSIFKCSQKEVFIVRCQEQNEMFRWSFRRQTHGEEVAWQSLPPLLPILPHSHHVLQPVQVGIRWCGGRVRTWVKASEESAAVRVLGFGPQSSLSTLIPLWHVIRSTCFKSSDTDGKWTRVEMKQNKPWGHNPLKLDYGLWGLLGASFPLLYMLENYN